MPGDPASRNDDELLSQIDELKARMDRLMKGGTSTSNSALLTESAKAQNTESERDVAAAPNAPLTTPERTRVRDLIETEDTEIVEVYPGPKEVVPFPADSAPSDQAQQAPVESPVVPERKPQPDPERIAADGSLISVDDSAREARPQAASFDDLGDVIQQELAKDASVPPIGTKKGPDLASRFGSVEDQAKPEASPVPIAPEVTDVPETDDEIEPMEDFDDPQDELDDEFVNAGPEGRSPMGMVAAIWVFTALVSGAIATLHFTGAI